MEKDYLTSAKGGKEGKVQEMGNTIELIENIESSEEYKLHVCLPYFNDIFKDLSDRSKTPNLGISEIVLQDYFNFPGMIGQRYFQICDVNKDGYLDITEFLVGIFKLYYSDYDVKMQFIFDMFDFDGDGWISKEDIRTLMSHVPLDQIEHSRHNIKLGGTHKPDAFFKYRIESMEEIVRVIDDSLGNLEIINCIQFTNICEHVASDMFLSIFLLLRNAMPGYQQFHHYEDIHANKPIGTRMKNKTHLNSPKSPRGPGKLLASPRLSSKFSPLAPLNRASKQIESTQAIKSRSSLMKYVVSGGRNSDLATRAQSADNAQSLFIKIGPDQSTHNISLPTENTQSKIPRLLENGIDETQDIPPPLIISRNKGIWDFGEEIKEVEDESPSSAGFGLVKTREESFAEREEALDRVSMQNFKKRESIKEVESSPIKLDSETDTKVVRVKNLGSLQKSVSAIKMGKEEPTQNENININKDLLNIFCSCGNLCNNESLICNECISSRETGIIKQEGWMYKKSGNVIKKFWFVIENSELYKYDNKEDTTHKSMHSLIGTFICEEKPQIMNKNLTLYPFTLVSPNKPRIYLPIDLDDQKQWIKTIKEAIGFYDLADYYELQETIGEGKFGIVKKGLHKNQRDEVAVKIMCKESMSGKDLELVRREIEILKMCQHPNIIQLYEIFENLEYIYIVMELTEGGDLYTYLEKRKFIIPESNSSKIIHALATGLFYLHSYGISHRDLKPENVLMVDNSDSSPIKIVDFGLSKIIDPYSTSTEPFGTLGYVAPEVLLQEPYNKNVDIWSLGVIAYLLLSGALPFDHHSEREVARQTIFDDPNYTHLGWKGVSLQGIDLCKKLLIKDKTKRLALEIILQHPFVTENCATIIENRIKSLSQSKADSFKYYVSDSPLI